MEKGKAPRCQGHIDHTSEDDFVFTWRLFVLRFLRFTFATGKWKLRDAVGRTGYGTVMGNGISKFKQY